MSVGDLPLSLMDRLPPRRQALLVLACELGSIKEAGNRLCMAPQTRKNHMTEVYRLFGVPGIGPACAFYGRWLDEERRRLGRVRPDDV